MDKAFTYEKPVTGIKGSMDTLKYWDNSVKYYKEKKYKESIISLLDYLNPEISKKMCNEDKSRFVIPHGSVIMELTINDSEYKISAPFLSLPENRENIIMRQIAEMNFATLFLSQIRLNGKELEFHFSNPIDLCEPYKMYDLFYEICVFADYYDDIFIDELGAKRLREMEVESYKSSDLDKFWKIFQDCISESLEFIDFCEKNRWYDSGIYCGMIGLLKTDYCLQPQGVLRSDIEGAVQKSFDKSLSNQEILENIKSFLTKQQHEDARKRFDESMYKPNFLLSVKSRSELPVVQNILSQDLEYAKSDTAQGGYFRAVYTLTYAIYNMLFRNTVPLSVEKILNDALKKAGGKPLKKAAPQLVSSVSKLF